MVRMTTPHFVAEKMIDTAIKSVDPYNLIMDQLRIVEDVLIIQESERFNLSDFENIYVLGAGKGAAPLAKAVEELLGDRICQGIISVKYGHGLLLKKIEIMEAGHPVLDENSLLSGEKILSIAEKAGKNDLVIMLLTGGGSSLMEALLEGVALQDAANLNKWLLNCGAAIGEINTVRKALSRIKGGKLAEKIYPAKTVSLILSDVIGDSLEMIASGPTVLDNSGKITAIDILKKYELIEKISPKIMQKLQKHILDDKEYIPQVSNFIIGNNLRALRAAENEANAQGYQTLILSDRIEGESREVSKMLSGVIKSIQQNGLPLAPPVCILLGGETTVTLKGMGKGGRNQEAVLAMLLAIKEIKKPFYFCSIGTDGSDGPTDAAGAWIDYESYKKAKKMNLNAEEYLKNNDSYHFFNKLGQLIKTGPTRTNVMDLMFILIERE